ncbi:L-lactate permease [Nocardia sp. NPDC127579]|uniref:L-lactate permease n=1 Tax=Nocardia sp. NPDC127579 TaxID=3345402 RepID=UPI00363D9BC7
MYVQTFDPLGNLGWSALLAALPLLTLFVLLGIVRAKAQWAGLAALGVSLVIAVAAYHMPIGQAFSAAGYGAAFSFLNVLWIVANALWIFKLTEASGHFMVLRRSFASISPDLRVQTLLVAFAFGALLEALAGAGTPVAISALMLISLGMKPMRAAIAALVANTAPVAFGALAVPVVTLAKVTSLDFEELGAIIGRQTSLVAAFVPLVLVFIVDGRHGLKQTWAHALVAGIAFGLGQFVSSNYVSVELADIVSALCCALALVVMQRVRPIRQPFVAETDSGDEAKQDSRGQVFLAYAPYLIVIAMFVVVQIPAIKSALNRTAITFAWPGLSYSSPSGKLANTAFTFNFVPSTGTLLLVAGVLTAALLRITAVDAARIWGSTVHQLRWTIVTVLAVLALAFVMNYSGQTGTLGTSLAQLGSLFAFVSPIIGWIGVAITGSDNSANALFGAVQTTAAQQTGLSPELMAAANSSGGVVGKMLSPQSLAIAAAVVGLAGREGDIFRKVLGYSLGLLLVLCVLVYLQSTPVLSWMLP